METRRIRRGGFTPESIAKSKETRAAQRAALPGTSISDVIAETGATYRQLDYWARTGLLVPSVFEATGSGMTPRRYSEIDVRVAALLTRLSAIGLAPSCALARAAAESLRSGSEATVSDGPLTVFVERA